LLTKPFSIKYDSFSSSSSFEIAIFFVRNDNSFGPSFNSTRISALSGSNSDSRIFSLSFVHDNRLSVQNYNSIHKSFKIIHNLSMVFIGVTENLDA